MICQRSSGTQSLIYPECNVSLCPGKHSFRLSRSLRSKRFGKAFRTFDALFAFLAAGKLGRAQKSAWRGRGKERRKRLHAIANPTILKNAPLTPSQLDEFIAWQLVNKVTDMKLWIYEIHIFELRNEEINVKKILAVINATYAVAFFSPDFFRLSFRNCISCVNNCEDLLYIYFFIPQFKYMNFIYSSWQDGESANCKYLLLSHTNS